MSFKPIFYVSDILVFLFLLLSLSMFLYTLKKPHWRLAWNKVLQQPAAVFAGIILSVYASIALLDSMHYVVKLSITNQGEAVYSATSYSVLDKLLQPLSQITEVSYAAPWATHALDKIWVRDQSGQYQGSYPQLLLHGNPHYKQQLIKVIIIVITANLLLYCLFIKLCLYESHTNWRLTQKQFWRGQLIYPYRTAYITLSVLIVLIGIMLGFCFSYHILGTDKVGNDVFFLAIKSIRTGLLIGSLTVLFMLPLAVLLGITAGYFGGKIDDLIQYIYTTISSIPGILLIAAAVLAIQVLIASHPETFASISQQADLRLVALCLILGLTGWTGLCRILRAETLKLREMDYIAAAKTLGTNSFKITTTHIIPNVMHLIIVTVILDFSALVLAEAVLTYVGVGVDPSTISWGNMIDAARFELAREPAVWWPLTAAFIFMLVFVLALNLFGDALRNALDPRTVID